MKSIIALLALIASFSGIACTDMNAYKQAVINHLGQPPAGATVRAFAGSTRDDKIAGTTELNFSVGISSFFGGGAFYDFCNALSRYLFMT